MSSRPKIAPGAPAAAASRPGCHSEKAPSPQPECSPHLNRASVFPAPSELFSLRRRGAGGERKGAGWGPEGAVPRGWAQGAAAPLPGGACFCPYKVWAAVGEGPGPQLRPVPPILLGARGAGTSQSSLVLLSRHRCAQSAQSAQLSRTAPLASRPVPHRSHGCHQEEDADVKAGQGECH